MNALTRKGGAPFQALVMAEESRLGREAIETAYALKRLITAGVQVWFYLDARQRTLDSPTDKVMLSLTAFADEMERERARQRTYDALQRKAKAGHVTGGRVFGYENLDVAGPDGKRSHVARRIAPAEADVIRRIFQAYLQGWGYTKIAKALNAEGAPTPRAQQGRPRGWARTSVLEVLRRDLYRGRIVWNKTQKRNGWGQTQVRDRAAGEWLTVEAPELRIVPEATWLAAQALRTARQTVWTGLSGTGAATREARFLLTGFLRCAWCGSSLRASWRGGAGAGRWFAYACTGYQQKGRTVCENNTLTAVGLLDQAVLAAVSSHLLSDETIDLVVAEVIRELTPARTVAPEGGVAARLKAIEAEMARLVAAVAAGAAPQALVSALRDREAERDHLLARQAFARRKAPTQAQQQHAGVVARRILTQWRQVLVEEATQLRPLLAQALAGPLVVTPQPGTTANRGVTFTGEAYLLGPLQGAAGVASLVASPPGFEPKRITFTGSAG
jgi:DNA invertase Pin-like site-specific DNA recombinase